MDDLKSILDKVDALKTQHLNLGGGPGIDDARAISQLIMGGGRASLEGQPLFGGGVPPGGNLGQGRLYQGSDNPLVVSPAENITARPAANISPSFQKVLDTADQIATSLSGGPAGTAMKTLLPNPFGPGSYDPSNPNEVAKVQEQRAKYDLNNRTRETLQMLATTENPVLRAGAKDITSQILEKSGLARSEYDKAFQHASGKAAGEAAAAGGSAKQNEELNTTAKKLANYEVPLSVLSRLPGSERLAIVAEAERQNPGFDMTQYAARQKVREQFASRSGYGGNITSLNTAVDHLDKVLKATDAIKNTDVQLLNALKNKGLEATGDPRITNLKIAIKAVTGEMATLFKGTSGTDAGMKDWAEALQASQSPEQIRQGVRQLVGLMAGRLHAIEGTWDQTMGKPRDIPILNKKSQQILDKYGLSSEIGDSVSTDKKTAAAAPQATAPQSALDYLKAHPEAKDQFKQKYGYLP